jgi:hypothetical protein
MVARLFILLLLLKVPLPHRVTRHLIVAGFKR